MATPKYFSNFSNVEYALHANKAGKANYYSIKNYFQLLRVRDDIYKEDTLYNDYLVSNGERPDQISYNLYGDEQWYWVILQINDITDYYNQWPLSSVELEEFIDRKYGGPEGVGATHHYETVRTLDSVGNLVLPGGMSVSQNFKFEYPATPTSTTYLSSFPVEISNYTYEKRLNENKSQIQVLDKKYIYEFDREVRKYSKKKATDNRLREMSAISFVEPEA